MNPRTLLVAALVALAALVAAPAAGAAVWQGPVPISDAAAVPADVPDIALGTSGDAAAGWWDNGAGGRLLLARKRAGGAWSAPTPLASVGVGVSIHVGVDGAGNVTAAWSTGGVASVTSVATWLASAAAPTIDVLAPDEPMIVLDLAVGAGGQTVLAGPNTAGGNQNILLGYRPAVTSGFQFNQKIGGVVSLLDPHVAINASGAAVVVYYTNNQIWASRRSEAADWGPVEPIFGAINSPGVDVGIDNAGNILAGILSTTGGAPTGVWAAFRTPTTDWAPTGQLTPTSNGFAASNIRVSVSGAGPALLTWKQEGPAPIDSSVTARIGSTATQTLGGAEVVSGGASIPRGAIGNDGTAVVTWEASGNVSQGRVRAPDGSWGAIQSLNAAHGNTSDTPVATDGRGHFAVLTVPAIAGVKQVLVSTFDMVAPAVSPIAVSGSGLAGDPLTLAVTASDEWSAIPSVTWAFGDGSSGTGASVAHAYANAGAYTAAVTVTDSAGNASVRSLAVTIAAVQSTLTTAKLSGKWTASRIKGTLLVKGTAPRAGTYVVDAFSGKTRKIHATFKLAAGAFSKTIKLPAKLLPGSYRVALTPSFPATQVTPAQRTAKLAAPIEGVVSTVTLSGTNGGPASKTLKGASTIWVTFRFASVSKGSLKLTWYRTIKGKRVALGSATKGSGKKVASYLRVGGLAKGTFTAVLARKGKIIAQGSVKAT